MKKKCLIKTFVKKISMEKKKALMKEKEYINLLANTLPY